MKNDFDLFDDSADNGSAIDGDIALIVAFLSRELSAVQIAAVQDRLDSDGAFRMKVQPLIDGWTLSRPGSAFIDGTAPLRAGRVSSVTGAETDAGWKRHEARAGTFDSQASVVRVPRKAFTWHRRKSMTRIAATIGVIVLPVIMIAQVVVYSAKRGGAAAGGGNSGSVAPANRDAQPPLPEVQPNAPEIQLRDAPLGLQLQPSTTSRQTVLKGGTPGANGTTPPRTQGQPSAPVLRLTREMRIDGTTSNFVSIGWVLPMRNGQVAVSQTQDRTILFFDSTGRSVGKFGRQGQGPGEFQTLGNAGLVGDSLWVSGGLQGRRITIMAPDFTFAREIIDKGAHPAPGAENLFPNATSVSWEAVYGDGTTLASPSLQQVQPTPPGYERAGTTLLRLAADGTIKQKVAHANTWDGIVSIGRGTTGYAGSSIPFFARTLFSVSERGGRIAVLSCNYDGPNARTMKLVVVSAMGDTIFSRNYPFAVVPVPNAERDRVKNEMVERTMSRGGVQATALAAATRTMTVPTFYPPYATGGPTGGLLVSEDGTVWIGLRSGEVTTVSSWLVIDRAGNVVGRAPVIANVRPMAISASQMWGIEMDQDGVPSVVRYRVAR